MKIQPFLSGMVQMTGLVGDAEVVVICLDKDGKETAMEVTEVKSDGTSYRIKTRGDLQVATPNRTTGD